MLERIDKASVVFYGSPLLRELGVPHAFSTRIGGTSPPPFDSLNLGNPSSCDTQDHWPRIHENYALLQRACGMVGVERCWVHQVHGGDVAIVRQGRAFESGAKADALICDDPDRAIAIRVADCVPILLAADDGRIVAAVHAGWRGIIAGAIPNAVVAMKTNQPISAAIGPCIRFDAFEVGTEVLRAFADAFGTDAPIRTNASGKGHVDLRAAARLQLIRAGIAPDRIDTTDRCTFRDRDEFFSHRSDRGITGRMAAIITPRRLPS